MATYVLQNSAQQIDQAVTAAYSSLFLGGTGLVRTTGTQTISGVKTFADQIVFSSGAILGNPTELNAVRTLVPTGNASVDLGSSSNRFKTGWFSGISGSVGVFQNLTVLGTLNATIVPASTLDGSTGNNVTLSGVTNLNNANFSGNINSAGTNTFSGNLNVTGNSVFNGTITATGNKTFSGGFSQTGNSSFFGNFAQSGTLFSTGTWNHTGNFNQTGSSAFLGSVSINSPNAAFNFSGDASNFNIISNLGVNGVVNITGSCNVTGAQHVIAGRSTFLNGITLSGGLTTNPIGGAVEYGNDGKFYFTNQINGLPNSPNRALLNQTYSIISPTDSNDLTLANSGVFYSMLNNTGIYLTTGTYKFYYNVNFANPRIGATPTAAFIRAGIFASNAVLTKRHGLVYQRFSTNQSAINYSRNIMGFGYGASQSQILFPDQQYVYGVPLGGTFGTANLYVNTGDANGNNELLNNFVFECVVSLSANSKVFPVVNAVYTNNWTVLIREFNMQVTQLTTGNVVSAASASGPWSDA
jgi:hypothetical protein